MCLTIPFSDVLKRHAKGHNNNNPPDPAAVNGSVNGKYVPVSPDQTYIRRSSTIPGPSPGANAAFDDGQHTLPRGTIENTHDMIDTKDSTNIHTRIDIAAPIERVKDDAVLAPMSVVDEDGLFEFFRDEYGSLTRRPK